MHAAAELSAQSWLQDASATESTSAVVRTAARIAHVSYDDDAADEGVYIVQISTARE